MSQLDEAVQRRASAAVAACRWAEAMHWCRVAQALDSLDDDAALDLLTGITLNPVPKFVPADDEGMLILPAAAVPAPLPVVMTADDFAAAIRSSLAQPWVGYKGETWPPCSCEVTSVVDDEGMLILTHDGQPYGVNKHQFNAQFIEETAYLMRRQHGAVHAV